MFADVTTRAYDPARRESADGAAAADLAIRMPRLVARAREISASLAYGVHGRKRAGVGETFWQYRPFASGESAHRIDWRRSARGDQLYVREREWEAAHDYFLWMDCSPSMAFGSSLAADDKLSRGVTLGLALADVLVRGGERAAALGLTAPVSARDVIDRLARALVDSAAAAARDDLPPHRRALLPPRLARWPVRQTYGERGRSPSGDRRDAPVSHLVHDSPISASGRRWPVGRE